MRQSLNPFELRPHYRPTNEKPALSLQRYTTRFGNRFLKAMPPPRLCDGVKSAMDFRPDMRETKEVGMETTPIVHVLPPVCNLNNVSGFGRRKKLPQAPSSHIACNSAFRRRKPLKPHNPYFLPRSLRHSPSDSRTYVPLPLLNPIQAHSFSPSPNRHKNELRLKWLVEPLSENLRKRNRERGTGFHSPGRRGG